MAFGIVGVLVAVLGLAVGMIPAAAGGGAIAAGGTTVVGGEAMASAAVTSNILMLPYLVIDLIKKSSDTAVADGETTEAAPKTVDDLLRDATKGRETKGKSEQWEKSGGYDKALEDFESLAPSDVRDIDTRYGTGKVGELSDGGTVVARPGSKEGNPTLEVQKSNGRDRIKIRYK